MDSTKIIPLFVPIWLPWNILFSEMWYENAVAYLFTRTPCTGWGPSWSDGMVVGFTTTCAFSTYHN